MQTIVLSSRYHNVGVSISTSAPWISATVNSSTTPVTIAVNVNPAAAMNSTEATVGTASGLVLVSSQEVTNSPLLIPVSLTVSSGYP